MVNVLVQRAVDRGFEPLSGKTKVFKIEICCFSDKQATLRGKNEYWVYQYPSEATYLLAEYISNKLGGLP